MKVKVSKKEYNYLLFHKKVSNNNVIDKNSKVIMDLDEDYIIDLHDWVNDRLQTSGFDENYELNEEGKILDNLIDILNI